MLKIALEKIVFIYSLFQVLDLTSKGIPLLLTFKIDWIDEELASLARSSKCLFSSWSSRQEPESLPPLNRPGSQWIGRSVELGHFDLELTIISIYHFVFVDLVLGFENVLGPCRFQIRFRLSKRRCDCKLLAQILDDGVASLMDVFHVEFLELNVGRFQPGTIFAPPRKNVQVSLEPR